MADVLTDRKRTKVDARPDDVFYQEPRFVTHADDGFLARLREWYDEILAPGDRVFDAMSSWVSHLPETEFERVVGHGLNEAELRENDALDEWFAQNLNEEQSLPLADDAFDSVLCALSVQYLQHPEAVFAEFERILAPGGTVIVSFTNRMFPTKAIRGWQEASMDDRLALIERYFDAAGIRVVRTDRAQPETDPFYLSIGQTQ